MLRLPDKAQAQLDGLLEAFSTGEVETAIAKQMIPRHPDDPPRPMDSWSLANRVMCLLSGTDDARGYRQWKEAGRHVRKGTKAVYILAPSIRKVRDTEVNASGQEVEVKREVVTGFRAIPVFRFEDTEGDELSRFDYSPPEPPPLASVAEAMGLDVSYLPGECSSAYGAYSPDREAISLFTHDRQTFWHELAHAAHDRCLPDRPLKGGQHPEQEAIAELSASVLARLYGAPNDGYTYDYLRRYTKTGDPHRLALRVIAEVEKVLSYILERAEQAQPAAA